MIYDDICGSKTAFLHYIIIFQLDKNKNLSSVFNCGSIL